MNSWEDRRLRREFAQWLKTPPPVKLRALAISKTRMKMTRWAIGILAVIGVSVGLTLIPVNVPQPNDLPSTKYIAPWSTTMQPTLVGAHHVRFTFTMTNRTQTPLTVRPWQEPAAIRLNRFGSNTPSLTQPLSFSKALVIPAGQSSTISDTVLIPPPGWYGVESTTVGLHSPGGQTWVRTALEGTWFSPYPAHTLRHGTVTLNQFVTRAGHTVRLKTIKTTKTWSTLTFTIGSVPYFPTNFDITITENGRAIHTSGTAQGASHRNSATGSVTLVGSTQFNPLTKAIKTLTVAITNLGINPSGTTTVPGPWTFTVNLPSPRA